MTLPSKPLLKYILVGVIGFALGLATNFLPFGKPVVEELALVPGEGGEKIAIFDNFIVKDTRTELRFFDRAGNEILIIEKD